MNNDCNALEHTPEPKVVSCECIKDTEVIIRLLEFLEEDEEALKLVKVNDLCRVWLDTTSEESTYNQQWT